MAEPDWQAKRKSGMGAIAVSMFVSIVLWFSLWQLLPPLAGMDSLETRMVVALKCVAVATLFCFVAGIEAVAHERLQSNAFDPCKGTRPPASESICAIFRTRSSS